MQDHVWVAPENGRTDRPVVIRKKRGLKNIRSEQDDQRFRPRLS